MISLPGLQICLRDWILDDLPAYRKWNLPPQRWMAFDGPYYPKMSKKQVNQVLDKMRRHIRMGTQPRPPSSLVIADLNNNQLLGRVTWYWIGKETNWMANGIGIYDPTYWGKGIGFEALGLWNQFLFDTFPDIQRLDLRTWSGNTGMMKLALKLGYREEARFRSARVVDGKLYDGMGYGILREEWHVKYPDGFYAHLTKNK